MRSVRRYVTLAALAGALAFITAGGPAVGATTDTWPMFHHDASHSGVSADTTISATQSSSLGVDWVANTGSQVYTSPAVANNTTLGKTLVFVGNQSGTMSAYDANTGSRIWYFKVGASIQSSPAVDGNVLYFGASDHYLYALNAATGQQICRFQSAGVISSSPVIANPDGTGKVVYFGDNGLTGSDDGGNVWAVNAVDPNAATDCSLKWQFNGFNNALTGVWSPPAFGVDKAGEPLIVFGTGDPDDTVVAVDAVTGAKVWQYQAPQGTDTDVGAGPTISAPGVNGFADGEVYISSKYREVYALDLATGALNWKFSIRNDSPAAGGATRSTAALLGNDLYVGYGAGVYDLNATTGAKVWKTEDFNPSTPEVISSPAIGGPANDRFLVVGDMGGTVRAYNMSGHQTWSYGTGAGNFIYSSPAIANGHVYIASSNGLLYAFNLGGGVSAKPSGTIASPTNGSTVTNTGAAIPITGTATDDTGVANVYVAVKNTTGRWWDPVSKTWSNVFQQYPATLGTPNGTSTTWSASFPPPADGGTFYIQAEAVDLDGQYDPSLPSVKITLTSLTGPPDTTITSPTFRQIFRPPVDSTTGLFIEPYYVNITGTATDTQGTNPGVKYVRVSVRNIQHGEYWCGDAGCPGEPDVFWQPTFTYVLATLGTPGGTSTTYSTHFEVYDHEHSYRIVAWAIDNDGNADPTRATGKTCINWPTDNQCL
jgi:outer membrane protein assembly factor BamB